LRQPRGCQAAAHGDCHAHPRPTAKIALASRLSFATALASCSRTHQGETPQRGLVASCRRIEVRDQGGGRYSYSTVWNAHHLSGFAGRSVRRRALRGCDRRECPNLAPCRRNSSRNSGASPRCEDGFSHPPWQRTILYLRICHALVSKLPALADPNLPA
jgi:hypothetical protein